MPEQTLEELVRCGDGSALEARIRRQLNCDGESATVAAIMSCEFGGRGARSAFHLAASMGRAEMIRRFLQVRCDPNARDDACNTALHLAASLGHARVAHLLLAGGASLDASNSFGRTVAQNAESEEWDTPYMQSGKAFVARMVKGEHVPYDELPAEPQATKDWQERRREPESATFSASRAPVRQSESERDVTQSRRFSAPGVLCVSAQQNDLGSLVLAELVRAGNVLAVETRLRELSASGASAVIAEVENCEEGLRDIRVAQSALHVAARRGSTKMLEVLLATRANPNTLNDQMCTPLHLAAETGRDSAVEALLRARADPLARNSFGKAAEALAFVMEWDTKEVAAGKAVVQKMLRQYGGAQMNVATAVVVTNFK
eukprot:gnl/TRDRNA2_/TRDRNA2_132456_c0_seq1.p1 gnl/TRDRNA2_/TRDRNA2_132456_c0~~gnl/TRDRNA2_/TRDRNA2_132456_c0_seq1.p1  ORF type:complete len:375 (-),score=64.42 gnl/TRDRNA2_/TRDRNA2_132456_c0_seq1:44-1168(-)